MPDAELRSAWHAVIPADSLKDWPIGVSVLDEPVALARMNGGLAAMRDVCAHMHAALSGGWIMRGPAGEQLVCPSHRWRYTADGRCAHIPELGDEQVIPDWTHVPAYPVCEHYGALWVCLEPATPAEPPRLPALENPRYRQLPILHQAWKLPAHVVMERFAALAGDVVGPGAPAPLSSPLAAGWVTRDAARAVLFTVTPLTRKASRGFWFAAMPAGDSAGPDPEALNAQAWDAFCQAMTG